MSVAKQIAEAIPVGRTFVTTKDIEIVSGLSSARICVAGREELVEINRHLHPRGASVGYVGGQWDIFSLTRETGRKLSGKMFGVDIESTGFARKKHDRICSIGIAYSNGSRTRLLVNPGIPIPREATEIHGIRDVDVASAPTFDEFAKRLATMIATSSSIATMVTHNGKSFDIPFLSTEFERAGINPETCGLGGSVDILQWARTLKLPHGHGLENVAKHVGVRFRAHHEADADAEATIKVAERFIALGIMPDDVTLAAEGPRKAKK